MSNTTQIEEEYLIGVDVGTGSVRAALVRPNGTIIKTESKSITTFHDRADFFEQSSEEIWDTVCHVIKIVSEGVSEQVKGIGFDATCSLVVLDAVGKPLTVSPTGKDKRNIILWMDHRAAKQAEFINKNQPEVLKYVGNAISLEMQTPKLMWIRENLPSTWSRAGKFFDLPDFLTWKASGDDIRSLCSVVCKWTFVAGPDKHAGWDKDYFKLIKLEELLDSNASKIGSKVNSPGFACGRGLTAESAKKMGLKPGTPVGASIIDAHAGGLGLLGCSAHGIDSLICGTSTCHMAVHEKPLLIPGVWGPYYSAMIPKMWLTEAGQSATGKLIDHVVETHPATGAILNHLNEKMHIHQYLNTVLVKLAAQKLLPSPAHLTKDLHIWPDFHGNRSPLADPSLLGMISGLSLSYGEEDLALKYLATIQALAYGTKHIISTLKSYGHDNLKSVLLCGGLSKNWLFVQTHADVLGLPVLLPKEPESVLLGAAMLAAVAAKKYSSVENAVAGMAGTADVVSPVAADIKYHQKKYKVFLEMVGHQKRYRDIMDE